MKIIKRIGVIAIDVVITASLLLGIYIYNYRIPHNGIPAYAVTQLKQASKANLKVTKEKKTKEDWGKKFQDKFSKKIVATDHSYKSPNISIEIKRGRYDSGIIDYSGKGRHVKLGTEISYTLADIYVKDIRCLQTAFAKDTYGIGYEEKLTNMSKRLRSILAVNGDSYSNNRHKNSGTIIRNGVVYRSEKTDMETCVLNWDGTMQIYQPDELKISELIKNGAYQSWVFGPSLLDKNGKAKKTFNTWSYIKQSHPRTSIGYFEPGHYCLLVVDGRQDKSRGMYLEEEAALFEKLGCKVAYNLDGGYSSFMTMRNHVMNHPYKTEKRVPDGIFVREFSN